tara:strand:+ start:15437 stop:15742 length:306 start_codon:yes stop_codon:yes gene_type:complete
MFYPTFNRYCDLNSFLTNKKIIISFTIANNVKNNAQNNPKGRTIAKYGRYAAAIINEKNICPRILQSSKLSLADSIGKTSAFHKPAQVKNILSMNELFLIM